MTVIRPNSVSGITSITAQANEINFFRSNGTLAGLQLNGVNFNTTTGVSTFNNLDVGGVLTYQDVTNVDSVGIITARSNIDCNGDLDVDGHTNLDNVNIVGVTTTTDNIHIGTRTHTANTSTALKNIHMGSEFWNGTAGDHRALKLIFYGTSGSAGQYGLGVSNNTLELQSNNNISFFAGGVSGNTKTRRFHITSAGDYLFDTGTVYVKDKIGHYDDTNTNIRFPTSDIISFETAGAERLRIDNNGYIGINDNDSTVGLSINKYGTQPVTNGNTYPYPAGNWSTVWNTTTANSTDYWCGFVGGYDISSATVNISLSPNTYNFGTQQGIYIAGEATSNSSADFTLGKIIGGSAGGASASAGNQRATKSEMLRVTSEGQLCIRNTGTSSQAANLIVFGNADNADAAIFSGGDWNRGLKLQFSANNSQNDQNVIYNAQGDNGQHIFSTGGNIVGRLEHDQSGFISENTASGDGDTEVGVALQNDYSSWGVIYKNDWIGNGQGWGTFWAGNGGARYRRVSSDNNPNEHVMVGSGQKRFTFDLDSGGQAYFDGSLTQNAYDYAEYFEWEDGNPSNEDRRGYSVFVNSNGKIEKATDSTNTAEIIGVISGTAAVVGDAAIYDWQGKWKVDEWGTLVTEVVKQVSWKDDEGKRHSYDLDKVPSGITIPSDASYRQHKRRILNTDYDDSKEYVPRDMRQEWDTVGLLGKVRVRDDSPKNPNWKFIKIVDGKKLWLIR